MQRAIGVWFQVACLLVATMAEAQEQKRIVILDFDGPGSAGVRAHVVDALRERPEVTMVPVREAENAANRLGVSLDEPADFARVAEDLQIAAFIGGSLMREGGSFRATVWVRDGATGQIRHEEPWTRKKKPQLKAIQGNFWMVMGPHIQASSPPSNAEPEPEAEKPAAISGGFDETIGEDEEEEAKPSTPSKAPALIISTGPRVLGRNLQFEEDQLGNLRSYETKAAIALAHSVQWYPGAHTRNDFVANVGLDFDADVALGLKSKENGKELKTTAYELAAGLIVRVPLEMFEPRFRVGYVRQVFSVDTPDTVFLPSLTYGSVRMGAGTAVKIIDALALDVNLAYLLVLSAEEMTSDKYFPDASVGAFEAGGGVLVRIAGPFAARAGIDWRRYFFDLKPKATALVQADSASDDYLRFTISFVLTLGGQNDQ